MCIKQYHCVSTLELILIIQAISQPNSESNRLSCLKTKNHRLPVFQFSVIDSTLLFSSSLPLLLSLAPYCMSAESKRHSSHHCAKRYPSLALEFQYDMHHMWYSWRFFHYLIRSLFSTLQVQTVM